LAAANAASPVAAQAAYDVLIRGGRIVDGTGNPWYEADVAVKEGRIVAIGRFEPESATLLIDAKGLIVTPGFIDVHTHAEAGIERSPTADNFLFDGVTSIITGNCGGSEADLGSFFVRLKEKGISLNLGSLIGHNTLRQKVMGGERRDPTEEEQQKMEAQVEEAMRKGAFGLSTGLIYFPGTYAKTAEVVGLARVAARFGGLYASHIRSEGEGVFEAIQEAIEVGRQAKIPVEISHFKVANRRLWGSSDKTISLVEHARALGTDVTVDQYPYTASATSLSVLLPSWALAGGAVELKARLSDETTHKKIAREMKDTVSKRNGRKHLDYAFVANCPWDVSLEGKNLSEITRLKGRKAKLEGEIETVLEMMARGGASMVYHSMNEVDVERIMRYPLAMVASDAGVIEFGRGVPHPRGYGTNARVLGRYVRERRVLRLEEAIRKMTSLPAQRFGLSDRGVLRPGMWADLVVFDGEKVEDAGTFERPHAHARGIRYVLVNGSVVVKDDEHTGSRPGQILLGPGAR